MSSLFPNYHATWETDEHRDLQRHAAGFLRKEATLNQDRWAKEHQVGREFWNKLGDVGLLGLDLPVEYAGAAGDLGMSAVVAEGPRTSPPPLWTAMSSSPAATDT